MTVRDLAWRAEETCLNAWPALREVVFAGWLLRLGGGVSRRANSANPLAPDSAADETLIAACEAFYRRHGMPPIFRIPGLIDAAIDERLAARGYQAEGETCTLYGAIDAVAAAKDPAVRLASRPTSSWLAAMAALQDHSKQQAASYRRIVRAIALPAAFAALSEGGDTVALAYGAIHDGLLCYESVITDARRRRRGYAWRAIAALAAWAKEAGAEGACLQVDAANTPARALYDRFGIKTELFRYHYRRAPADPVGLPAARKG